MGHQQRDSGLEIKEMWILKMSGTMCRSQTDPAKERAEEGTGISGGRNMVIGITRSYRTTCGGVVFKHRKDLGWDE